MNELSSDQSSHKVDKLCDQVLNHEFPKAELIELVISVIQEFKEDINKGIVANTWWVSNSEKNTTEIKITVKKVNWRHPKEDWVLSKFC